MGKTKRQRNLYFGVEWGTRGAWCVLCTLFVISNSPARASDIAKIWFEVYRELNPSEEGVSDDLWKADRNAWAKREEKRLEPVVLSILRGERPQTEWTRALFVARAIPTTSICEVLVGRLRELAATAPNGCFGKTTREEGSFALIVTILGTKGDERARPIAIQFATRECQPSLVVERCVEALQHVGDKQTIAQLGRIPLRSHDAHIDRLCALAEKVIDARESGRDMLANAESELRSLTARYLHALETKDTKAYVDVHVFGFRRAADESKVAKDVFDSPGFQEVVDSLKRAAGRESFDVDRDKLTASITLSDHFKLTYVFEVDGWKIAGPTQIAP